MKEKENGNYLYAKEKYKEAIESFTKCITYDTK